VHGQLTPVGHEHGYDQRLASDRRAIRWWNVPPGRYRLVVHAGDHVFYELPSLDVGPGENVWPAGGARIDLLGTSRVRCIAARSARDEERLEAEMLLVDAATTALPTDWTKRLRQQAWHLVPERPHEVLVRARKHVPMRVAGGGPDVALRMQPRTQVRFDAPLEYQVLVRILDDPVTYPLLRAFDCHSHAPAFDLCDDSELSFAPGTLLELQRILPTPGTPMRVVVGTESPQRIDLR
jgi:hypothetical protein